MPHGQQLAPWKPSSTSLVASGSTDELGHEVECKKRFMQSSLVEYWWNMCSERRCMHNLRGDDAGTRRKHVSTFGQSVHSALLFGNLVREGHSEQRERPEGKHESTRVIPCFGAYFCSVLRGEVGREDGSSFSGQP
jgi:hypothetical protein